MASKSRRCIAKDLASCLECGLRKTKVQIMSKTVRKVFFVSVHFEKNKFSNRRYPFPTCTTMCTSIPILSHEKSHHSLVSLLHTFCKKC